MVRVAGSLLVLLFVTFTIWMINMIIRDLQPGTQWAPFATNIVAMTAVGIAIYQQRTITQRETEVRNRKARAARAVLPLALSEFCEYAGSSADVLKKSYPRPAWNTGVLNECPSMPPDTIKVLQACIEHSESKDAEIMSTIIREVQVQHFRMKGLVGQASPSHRFDSVITNTVAIYALSSAIFKFARNETNHIFERPDYSAAANILRIYEGGHFPDAYAMIKKRLLETGSSF